MVNVKYYNHLNINKKNIITFKKEIFKKKKIIVFKNQIKNQTIDKIFFRLKKIKKKKPKFFYPNVGCQDLYLFNDNNPKSKVRGCYKRFMLFPWNKSNNKIFKDLKKFFHLKLLLDENKQLKKNYDKNFYYTMQVMHYPYKIGYLNSHTDGASKSLISIGFNDSYSSIFKKIKKNKRIKIEKKGHLEIKIKNKRIYPEKYLKEKDVVVCSASEPHKVKKNFLPHGKVSLLIQQGFFDPNLNKSVEKKK